MWIYSKIICAIFVLLAYSATAMAQVKKVGDVMASCSHPMKADVLRTDGFFCSPGQFGGLFITGNTYFWSQNGRLGPLLFEDSLFQGAPVIEHEMEGPLRFHGDNGLLIHDIDQRKVKVYNSSFELIAEDSVGLKKREIRAFASQHESAYAVFSKSYSRDQLQRYYLWQFKKNGLSTMTHLGTCKLFAISAFSEGFYGVLQDGKLNYRVNYWNSKGELGWSTVFSSNKARIHSSTVRLRVDKEQEEVAIMYCRDTFLVGKNGQRKRAYSLMKSKVDPSASIRSVISTDSFMVWGTSQEFFVDYNLNTYHFDRSSGNLVTFPDNQYVSTFENIQYTTSFIRLSTACEPIVSALVRFDDQIKIDGELYERADEFRKDFARVRYELSSKMNHQTTLNKVEILGHNSTEGITFFRDSESPDRLEMVLHRDYKSASGKLLRVVVYRNKMIFWVNDCVYDSDRRIILKKSNLMLNDVIRILATP